MRIGHLGNAITIDSKSMVTMHNKKYVYFKRHSKMQWSAHMPLGQRSSNCGGAPPWGSVYGFQGGGGHEWLQLHLNEDGLELRPHSLAAFPGCLHWHAARRSALKWGHSLSVKKLVKRKELNSLEYFIFFFCCLAYKMSKPINWKIKSR